ncbi:hypothetical protein [Pajaroellobacter abortibovis]|uniref:DUF4013 domain-containing protein n=1 Tax=Pajaroellobacter abortibovis TaxID=1882918 RepID=A0A1L6MXB7_9BACT|nr:hypothetical protein [Pajaroellobacter abortibovis]APS00221.1 hypothetical protein BCY86_05650 [Pajaroellobacter abortibovis]
MVTPMIPQEISHHTHDTEKAHHYSLPTSLQVVFKHHWSLLGFWAWQVALTLAVTSPFLFALHNVYGNHPSGDQLLWKPGGVALQDLLDQYKIVIDTFLPTVTLWIGFAWFVGLIPLAMLIQALGDRTQHLSFVSFLKEALRSFRPLATLALIFISTELLVAGGGAFFLLKAADTWTIALGERNADLISFVGIVFFLIGSSILGVYHDISRVEVVYNRMTMGQAMSYAFRLPCSKVIALYGTWAWRICLNGILLMGGGFLAQVLSSEGKITIIALGVLHQLFLFTQIILKASWLARLIQTSSSRSVVFQTI